MVRRWRTVVCALLPLGVLSALLTARDSFPFSDYPMFATPRPRQVEVVHFLGQHRGGTLEVLPPTALGTREVIGAAEIARTALASPARAAELCAFVAGRVDGFQRIVVRVDRFDALSYFETDRHPIASRELTRCVRAANESRH
jgi:hypothetical protein